MDLSLERRIKTDRRNAHIKAAIYGLFLGRRKAPRRITDKTYGYIIDYIEPKLIIFIFLPFILSILDSLFTLWLLTQGGAELNPLMKILIDKNPVLFFILKILLTNMGIIITFLFRYFKIFGRLYVMHLLYSILSLYIGLILYELYLIIIV